MSSPAINTVAKMMESLPDSAQEQIVEHLREYILDLQDDRQWNDSFNQTDSKLVEAARKAKQEIAQGLSQSLDYENL